MKSSLFQKLTFFFMFSIAILYPINSLAREKCPDTDYDYERIDKVDGWSDINWQPHQVRIWLIPVNNLELIDLERTMNSLLFSKKIQTTNPSIVCNARNVEWNNEVEWNNKYNCMNSSSGLKYTTKDTATLVDNNGNSFEILKNWGRGSNDYISCASGIQYQFTIHKMAVNDEYGHTKYLPYLVLYQDIKYNIKAINKVRNAMPSF